MDELVLDMIQDDPSKRPTMNDVMPRFEKIVKGLSNSKLQTRIRYRNESTLETVFSSILLTGLAGLVSPLN